MIANRYLQRDYRRMEDAGIKVENNLFTLEAMMVKFDTTHQAYGEVMAIHDYINLAREGTDVSVDVQLEYVPAVEHFASHKNAQIFLMADFEIAMSWKNQPYRTLPGLLPERKRRRKIQRQWTLPMTA